MTETNFPPPAPEPAPTGNWWSRKTTKGKVLIGAAGAVGVLVIAGAALGDPDEEGSSDEAVSTTEAVVETTEAPSTTEAVVETTEAPVETVAPTTEAPAVDPFQTWLLGELPTVLGLADDMSAISPMLDEGDITGAAQASADISDTYRDLYLAAPETGTELSNVTNDMLLTCSVAYDSAAVALFDFDVAGLEDATLQIQDCNRLIGESTELLPS